LLLPCSLKLQKQNLTIGIVDNRGCVTQIFNGEKGKYFKKIVFISAGLRYAPAFFYAAGIELF